MKFTQANVRNLKATLGKTDETVWDENMPGFGIRFRNGGAGIFVIVYSLHGKQTRLQLGKVAQVNLVDAQNEAKQLFAAVAKKVDPLQERASALARSNDKFGDKIALYIAHLEKSDLSPGYIGDHKRILQRYMTELHRYGISEITRAQIAAELDKIEDENGRRQAGLARSYVHGFYGWAISKGWLDVNPATGTEKRASERRERVLTPQELVAIWNAVEGDGDFGKIVRLLMLTAARKTQIGSLNRKTELKLVDGLIDFVPPHVRKKRGQDDADRGKTKNKERFWLALSPQAAAILETVPARAKSDFVFGGSKGGRGGFSCWNAAKQRLDERLGDDFEPWVFHDFRRTFLSLGIEKVKIPPWIADVCLHHVGEHKKGIKRTYNHADYIDEKRDAMGKWADYVEGLTQQKLALAA